MDRSTNAAAKVALVVGTLLFLMSVIMSWRQVDTPLSEALLWVGFVLVLAPSLGIFTRKRS